MTPAATLAPAGFAGLTASCKQALGAADQLTDALRTSLHARLARDDEASIEAQHALHGLAWVATTVQALRELLAWAERLARAGRLGEREALLLRAGWGEYLGQLDGGVPMSQGEIFRPHSVDESAAARFRADPAVCGLIRDGFNRDVRSRLAHHLVAGRAHRGWADPGFDDPVLADIHEASTRWADDHAEAAHRWHLANALIPDPVLEELARLGVFGLTVPRRWGGSGLGKTAMCVVTEALSRSWIGFGSLGTRTEIASELILGSGTPAQQDTWLPGLCQGTVIPAAAFTEPDTGSDLAQLRTRAQAGLDEQGQPVWRLYGAKTWTTHGARSDLLTMLVRTEPDTPGYRGLSMMLVPKPRGSDAHPFPAAGMRGSEIEVLGYRGMKEYEIAFDGYTVPAQALLGGVTGQGFKQLMRTFESARIQTAARAVGVAQSALELGLDYACQRSQFGGPIMRFPRVADKLVWMAVEIMTARQLTFHAAREKDAGRRCDLQAGMAKLLAARTAWAAADNAVQVHGGNGYALEYPISRVLVDARILSVFEGAAEIQAQIIARALLDRPRST